MRNITLAMKNYLATDNPSLCNMWEITTDSGVVKRSTDFSSAIIFGGNTYASDHGQEISAISYSIDLNDDHLAIRGFIDTFATKAELLSGLFDNALVSIFKINPFDHTMGKVMLMSGNMGKISIEDVTFTAEISSKVAALKTSRAVYSSPTCRAQLGDSACGVSLGPFTTTGVVTAFDAAAMSVTVTVVNTALVFTGGALTWTAGLNNGSKAQVKSVAGSGSPTFTFALGLFPLNDVVIGDTFSIVQGCDKSYATCLALYNNKDNFRGEPFLPGSTKYFDRVDRK